MSIQRFRITWDGMTYKVSEPGIESCEVVLAHIYDALQERVAELELRRSETAAMCEQLTVDLESCHTQVSTLQASDRACAEAGADNLSLRLLLADKLATVTAERDAFQVGQLEVAKFLGYGVGAQLSLQSFIMQQLAASQARCREMEEKDKLFACESCYQKAWITCSREDAGAIESYSGGMQTWWKCEHCWLKATLAARDAERDDERRKLQDVCMAHGPALIEIHDLERELKRLQLTWTTARPTVAGLWLLRRDGEVLPVKIADDGDARYWDVKGYGMNWSLSAMPKDSEWAGPIPLPTEAQQASGRSGGAEGHGGQP